MTKQVKVTDPVASEAVRRLTENLAKPHLDREYGKDRIAVGRTDLRTVLSALAKAGERIAELEEAYKGDALTINDLACKYDDACDRAEAAEAQLAISNKKIEELESKLDMLYWDQVMQERFKD